MDIPPDRSAEEIKRLQRCINDLVSVLALPALWSGGEPVRVASASLDVLLGMLRLDFAYARLEGETPVELVRVRDHAANPQAVLRALEGWLARDPQAWPTAIANPIGGGTLSIVPQTLGLHGEMGIVVVGSKRPGFPDETERLVLNVAVNQAAIGIREAELLTQQKRLNGELDRRAAERSAALAVANDELDHAQALLAGEKRLLEMVAAGRPLQTVLEALCLLVEETAGGGHCSVVLVDPSGTRLEHGAAPSLPASFVAAIVGRPVNCESGPCAMAAALGEQVTSIDLEAETRWDDDDWCPMALAHGLRSCCSTPIRSSAGKVLGAFAIYYTEPRAPTPQHLVMIDQLTHIASIAVERTQGDAALIASEARKAAVLDSALDCIVTIDHESRITEFNPAAERTFGYRRDDVVGRRLVDVIVPPGLRQQHRDGFARYLATGEAHVIGKHVELTALRADGTEFPVELAITRIPVDGPPSFTGFLRDITERKRAEEQLRRSEAFLSEGEAISETGSFLWRVATDDITWSDQLYRIYEFDRTIPVSLELLASRVHPEDARLLEDLIARVREAGSNFEYEHRLLMPDGAVKHLHLVAHAAWDQYGGLEYIGAVQDITERRRSEAALERVRSELAHMARVTSLGALTASIAHEVNQPLSGIITNASTCLRMLATDPPNVDGARETARRTIRDGNRASDVITRLRAMFARKGVATELVDLNDAAREVIALSAGDLQHDRVVVQTEFAADLPPVLGDRVQLQQVILNLVRNAADAMSAIEDRARELTIRTARDADECARLTVLDSGTGFDPQGAERLFEAFYTTKSDGMGMGLSICRSIIGSHNGRLWAAPNEGPGAAFSFSIPCGTEGSLAN